MTHDTQTGRRLRSSTGLVPGPGIPEPRQERAPHPAPRSSWGPALYVRRGPGSGSRFVLPDDSISVLGRHPDRDIVLPSLSVSRRHARLRPESGRFTLDDLGSLNGTFVNGKPIDSVVLADGDEIAIGLIRLVFGTGEHVHAAGSVRPAA